MRPLSHCYEEKYKNLINLRKAKNGDIDAVNVWSMKISKSLLECSTITVLVAAFDAKAFNDTELFESCLAGRNRIINFCRQTNQKCRG